MNQGYVPPNYTLYGQASDSWPGKNLLDDHCAANEAGRQEADVGRYSDQTIAKDMHPENTMARVAFGPGRCDIRLFNYF